MFDLTVARADEDGVGGGGEGKNSVLGYLSVKCYNKSNMWNCYLFKILSFTGMAALNTLFVILKIQSSPPVVPT